MRRFTMVSVAAVALVCTAAAAQQPDADGSILDLPICSGDHATACCEIKAVTVPSVGAEQTVEAGEPIYFSDAEKLQYASLKITKNIAFNGQRGSSNFTVTIPAATYSGIDVLALDHHVPYGSYLLPNATIRMTGKDGSLGAPSHAEMWISVAKDGTTLDGALKLGSWLFSMEMANGPFTRSFCRTPDSQVLRQEITYSGVVKGVVTLDYREYAGGVARPAFSQHGTFDLAAGNEIAFKGVHLKVFSASNLGIHYVVLPVLPN